jgi:hypothetical protein
VTALRVVDLSPENTIGHFQQTAPWCHLNLRRSAAVIDAHACTRDDRLPAFIARGLGLCVALNDVRAFAHLLPVRSTVAMRLPRMASCQDAPGTIFIGAAMLLPRIVQDRQ